MLHMTLKQATPCAHHMMLYTHAARAAQHMQLHQVGNVSLQHPAECIELCACNRHTLHLSTPKTLHTTRNEQIAAPEGELCHDVHANRHADSAQRQLPLRPLLLLPALLQQLQQPICSSSCYLCGAATMALRDVGGYALTQHTPAGKSGHKDGVDTMQQHM
jgi:hypothetical protein